MHIKNCNVPMRGSDRVFDDWWAISIAIASYINKHAHSTRYLPTYTIAISWSRSPSKFSPVPKATCHPQRGKSAQHCDHTWAEGKVFSSHVFINNKVLCNYERHVVKGAAGLVVMGYATEEIRTMVVITLIPHTLHHLGSQHCSNIWGNVSQ